MLIKLVFIATLGASLMLIPTLNDRCVGANNWLGGCSTTNTGTSIVVEGTQQTPPDSGTVDAGPGANTGGDEPGGDGEISVRDIPPEVDPERGVIWITTRILEGERAGEYVRVCHVIDQSKVTDGSDPCAVEPEVDPRDTVTIADLASFTPAIPELVSDPEGAGIMGAHANIVATATTHTVNGSLFGEPVTVRFTPAMFHFDYGDGATVTTDTGGALWASLGVAQFTPTATSHVYRTRGTYAVTITVEVTAEVQFASDGLWRSIPGTLTTPASTTSIRIYEARTALVEHTCIEAPHAAGC